ncbi:MAG: type II secretion system protein [Phycisphaerae bacterium]|jgi:prepilin-type N-terminal cleavage/methylation domain-containing protein
MLQKIKNNGFTLIEILVAVVLLGIAIAAIVGSNAAFSLQTSQAGELSTAEFLIEQIRELTALMPVNDPNQVSIYGFDGDTFNPPIDGQRRPLANFSAYSQVVTVDYVNATNFQQIVADNSSDFVRITVKILYNGSEISQAKWIRCIE